MHFASNLGAGVQHARDDGGIEVGDVTLQRRRAVHHRHAGEHDIVLERDGLALELAARGALHGRFAVPGVARIFLRRGLIARRARIFHLRHFVGHGAHEIVGFDRALHQSAERGDIFIGQRKAALLGDAAKLGWCGKDNCHGALLEASWFLALDGQPLGSRLHGAGQSASRRYYRRKYFPFQVLFSIEAMCGLPRRGQTGLISLKSRPSASARYICIRV